MCRFSSFEDELDVQCEESDIIHLEQSTKLLAGLASESGQLTIIQQSVKYGSVSQGLAPSEKKKVELGQEEEGQGRRKLRDWRGLLCLL